MSARWEGKVLLEPITADQPCGQNLEDTHRMASFDTFRLFGQATPHDPVPEWTGIRDAALEALRESKDLRLLAHLGTALLRTDGLPGFAETLDIAAQWLTAYWNEVYPLVDDDAMLRRNALNCFADQMAVVEGLRRLPLVSSRQHGRFSLREIEIAAGHGRPAEQEAAPDESQIAAAFGTMPVDGLTRLQESAARALSAIQRIDGTMRSRADGLAPALDPLVAVMTKIDRVLRGHLAARTNGNGHQADPGDSAIPALAGREVSPSPPVGAIRSRQDALRALDAVADFFRQTEPASPVPLFLERAKRLVGKSFLEVLADVAPEALAQARAAGGVRDE
jgi:type VI secretion system protein ImpA